MIINCVHDYADETDEDVYVTMREKVIKTMQAEIKIRRYCWCADVKKWLRNSRLVCWTTVSDVDGLWGRWGKTHVIMCNKQSWISVDVRGDSDDSSYDIIGYRDSRALVSSWCELLYQRRTVQDSTDTTRQKQWLRTHMLMFVRAESVYDITTHTVRCHIPCLGTLRLKSVNAACWNGDKQNIYSEILVNIRVKTFVMTYFRYQWNIIVRKKTVRL